MIRLTCSLQFTDGQVVMASVLAKTRVSDAAVSYSGPAERLPFQPEAANPIELHAYFASFARELGATFREVADDHRTALTPEIDKLLDRLKGLTPRHATMERPRTLATSGQ